MWITNQLYNIDQILAIGCVYSHEPKSDNCHSKLRVATKFRSGQVRITSTNSRHRSPYVKADAKDPEYGIAHDRFIITASYK